MKKLMREGLGLLSEVVRNHKYDICSRWAVKRIVMEDGEPFSLDDYPYVEEIINSRAKRNWVMKGAQTGLTTAAYTISFFEIDYHKRDVIYFFPTNKMADRFSKTRFSNAIDWSDYLKARITRDDIELKQIDTSTLYILGANSESNLRGTSAGRLFFDELDAWTERQIYMAEERASGQKNNDKIIWAFSTPKYPNHGIHKQFLRSTQEHYHFDCPHCQEQVRLDWQPNDEDPTDFGAFRLFGETQDDPEIYKSYIKCPKCDEKLDHAAKSDWLRAKTRGGTGEWIALNPDADPLNSRGFHISQLYSPTVEPWELAFHYLRGRGDEDARREFYNSKLGLPYIEDAHQVLDSHIEACFEKGPSFSMSSARPKSTRDGLFTLGIDQGGPVHHWTAVRWLFDKSRGGSPIDMAIGRVAGCGRVLAEDWPSLWGLMRAYRVRCCVIDWGPDPTKPREMARQFADYVYLCQVVEGLVGRELRIVEDEYGASVVKADKVGWTSKSLGRIMAGDMEFPVDLPLEFRDHVKAPVRSLKQMPDKSYRAFYQSIGLDHYASSLVFANIALAVHDPNIDPQHIITDFRK